MRNSAFLKTRVFSYFVLKSAAKILWFKSEYTTFTWTLVLVFFSDLVRDNVYRKIAAAFVHYLVSCKLDLKLGHCCSILGQATNQMRFKQTVLMQQGAAILRKTKKGRQIQYKAERLLKVMNIYKHLATLAKSYEYLKTLSK